MSILIPSTILTTMTIDDRNQSDSAQPIGIEESTLPDVASDTDPRSGRLDWVGMDAIDLPILLVDDAGGSLRVPARVGAFVDLRAAETRGIHMSRLYLQLDRA